MLVVGGRGYVGSHVIKAAATMGVESTSVSRKATDSMKAGFPNLTYISGDALNPHTFEDSIKDADTISNPFSSITFDREIHGVSLDPHKKPRRL